MGKSNLPDRRRRHGLIDDLGHAEKLEFLQCTAQELLAKYLWVPESMWMSSLDTSHGITPLLDEIERQILSDQPDGLYRLGSDGSGDRAAMAVYYVRDEAAMNILIDDMYTSGDRQVELDFETTGFKPSEGILRLVQFAYTRPDGQHVAVVADVAAMQELGRLVDMLQDGDIVKRIHNSRFEQTWALGQLGCEIHNVFDTFHAWQTAQKMLGRLPEAHAQDLLPGWQKGSNGLAGAAYQILGLEISKEEQASDWSAPQLRPSQLSYAATDVLLLGPLGDRLEDLLHALGSDSWHDQHEKTLRVPDAVRRSLQGQV